ncbi:MAG: bifunctional diaminohydroxyphosphoribosylaminopyrimidine deaminase/5-amino-6-(5-phosphoribosylamino)uracil reductase RibD [Firmicutes bacterium]|nr:bifunctional diaminohydroxyphosphoribosylaminopyrimidine deaminase/5-amino-6-(5-phosphoribosylamino)uracil reductase RibD [Bacillota bacterium]
MEQAVALAALGEGQTMPNPLVGAVIVQQGRLVGQGAHLWPGEPHAEILALAQAGKAARGATLFVTLEPCNHWGRTPPCTHAILEAGIARVVVGACDPNPVAAGGIAALTAAGVEVETGLLETVVQEQNRAFFFAVTHGRPYVVAKWAMTLDGRVATVSGDSRWVTGEAARREVHRLRAQSGAVLVGRGTVAADDPQLTVRLVSAARQPLRVVLDSQLRLPLDRKIFDTRDAPTLLFHTEKASSQKQAALRERGVEVLQCPSTEAGTVDLSEVLAELARRQIRQLLVEAGPQLMSTFLRQGFVDEMWIYIAPAVEGGAGRPPTLGSGAVRMAEVSRWEWVETTRIGDDLRLTLRPRQQSGAQTDQESGGERGESLV